jgi:hypothetical protein
MTESSIRVEVRDWVGDLGALDPSVASRLAQHVIDKRTVAQRIVLDFRGVRSVSSGFANELFVSLARVSPLTEWQDVLTFSGLASTQAQVIAKSLNAARKLNRTLLS